jgi:hypothetical protein
MDVTPPAPEVSKQSRKRGRKAGSPLTARELAARRANLAKAWAAGYRPTEKRRRASRANLERALAARRSPEGRGSAQLNALKHGLFARKTVAESVLRLGEDPKKFKRHLALFRRVFIPTDDDEKRMVRELAEVVWRRLRLFHAQARWEMDRLHRIYAQAPAPAQLDLDDTVARANGLTLALVEFDAFFRESSKLESQVETCLRKLILKRSDGKLRWKGFCPRRDPVIEKLEEVDEVSHFVEVWNAMSPAERTAMLDQVQKTVDAKMGVVRPEGMPF